MHDDVYRTPSASQSASKRLRRLLSYAILGAVAALSFSGCSAGERPLAIHMYNPKTHQAFTCSARDPGGFSDVALLAQAVESCARTFEARGFIREG